MLLLQQDLSQKYLNLWKPEFSLPSRLTNTEQEHSFKNFRICSKIFDPNFKYFPPRETNVCFIYNGHV